MKSLHLILLFSFILLASALPRFRSVARHNKKTKAPCEDLGGACLATSEECGADPIDATGECPSGVCCIRPIGPPAPPAVDPPLDVPLAELVAPTCGAHQGETPAECLSAADADCSICLGSYDGACVAEWALYVGRQWRICGMRYTQGADRHVGLCDTNLPVHSQGGDCSSFVSTVLNQAGYSCFTRHLQTLQMISTLGYRTTITALHGVYHKDAPVVGDLIMWEHGTTGHIGIVYEVQDQCIRLVNEGGPEPTGPTGWATCRSYDPADPQSFIPHASGGVAGYKGFWTPVPRA